MGRKHGEKPAYAFGKVKKQTRYYRVKYYFDVIGIDTGSA